MGMGNTVDEHHDLQLELRVIEQRMAPLSRRYRRRKRWKRIATSITATKRA